MNTGEILAKWRELDHACLLLTEYAVRKRSALLANSSNGKIFQVTDSYSEFNESFL